MSKIKECSKFVLILAVFAFICRSETSSEEITQHGTIVDHFTEENTPISQSSCNEASESFLWALNFIENCTTSPTPICEELNPNAFYSPTRTNLMPLLEPFLIRYNITWASRVTSGIDLLLTAQISDSSFHGTAQLGEISYTLDAIAKQWSQLFPSSNSYSNVKIASSQFWNVWTMEWMNTANRILNTTSNLKANSPIAYLRASNYYFLAFQPFPISEASQQAFELSYDLLFTFLEVYGQYQYQTLLIPYVTDNGEDVELPATLIEPVGISNPRLIVSTCGGLDWPLPGYVIGSVFSYLQNGYAVLIYEGPGQGRTLYSNPPLRFTSRWDRVLEAVTLFAYNTLPTTFEWNQDSKIVATSESFGGFLIPQACSLLNASLIQGCIADPATPSMAFAFNYAAFGHLLSAFETFNQTLLSEMCGESCFSYFQNYFGVTSTSAPLSAAFSRDQLITSLTSSSCEFGQILLSKYFYFALEQFPNGIVPTDFVYLALSIVSPSNTTYNNISDLLNIIDTRPDLLAAIITQGYYNIQDYYISQSQVQGTQIPIGAFGTSEDFVYESPLTEIYYSNLPSNSKNRFQFYGIESGAAIHCEVGAWDVAFVDYLDFMNNLGF